MLVLHNTIDDCVSILVNGKEKSVHRECVNQSSMVTWSRDEIYAVLKFYFTGILNIKDGKN